MKHFLTEKFGQVLRISINRPDVRNALHAEAHHELSMVLDDFEADDELLVAVLTGVGKVSFCAGRDLKDLARLEQADAADRRQEAELWERTIRLTDRFGLTKILVARLNGSAYGGGFELALACDIIVAADHAELALPEPRRGLIAMGGGVHRLPRQIGLKAAMGYLLSGRSMSAGRAFELGLVNEVVAYEQLDEAVDAWVNDILRSAPLALRATKQCAMEGLGLPLQDAVARSYEWEERRKRSDDAKEGPRAFAAKRTPKWSGR